MPAGGCDGQLRLWDIRRSGALHVFDQHDTQQQHTQQREQQQQGQQQQLEEVEEEVVAEQRQGQARAGRQRSGAGRPGKNVASGASAGRSAPADDRMFLSERQARYSTAHADSITGAACRSSGPILQVPLLRRCP